MRHRRPRGLVTAAGRPARRSRLALLQRIVWAASWLGPRTAAPDWVPDLPPERRLSLPGRGDIGVRYVDGPAGAVPVLLLHGVTWSGAINFHALIGPLAEEHPVIVMDHRGHGGGLPGTSPVDMGTLADDAVAVLEELGVERAIVAGFSLGSLAALHVALRHRKRVAGMVLSAGCLVIRDNALERAGLRIFSVGMRVLGALGLGRSLGCRYFGLTRRLGGEEFARRWPWLRNELERHHPRDMAAAVEAARRHDLRGRVAPLRAVPTVVVVHERDLVIPPRLQRAMAAELHAGTIVVDADHEAPLSEPEEYRDAILRAVAAVRAQLGSGGQVPDDRAAG